MTCSSIRKLMVTILQLINAHLIHDTFYWIKPENFYEVGNFKSKCKRRHNLSSHLPFPFCSFKVFLPEIVIFFSHFNSTTQTLLLSLFLPLVIFSRLSSKKMKFFCGLSWMMRSRRFCAQRKFCAHVIEENVAEMCFSVAQILFE